MEIRLRVNDFFGLRRQGEGRAPELHKALEQLREGDVLVVWKLDRLSRSLKNFLQIMDHVHQKGAGFRSIPEAIEYHDSCGSHDDAHAGKLR